MTMAFAPPQPAYSGGRRSFSVGKLFLLGEEDAIPACARNGLEYIACTFLPTMKKSRSDARLPTANDSPFGGGDELSFHISSAPSNTAGICLVDTDGDACGGAGPCCGGTPRSGAATDGAASAHRLTCCATGGTGLQHSASSSTGLSCDSGTSSPPLFPAQPADAIPPPAASASASAAASALPLAGSPHAPSAGGGLAAAAAAQLAAPASSAAAAAKAEASREALLAACGGAEGLMGAFGILTNDQWTTLQAAVAGAAAARAATAAAAAGSSEDEDHGPPRLLRSGRPSVEVPSARPSAEFARPSAGSSARPSLDRSDGGGSGAPRSTGSGAERADSATSIASLWAAVTAAASSNRSDAAALQAAAAAAAAASGAVYDSSDDAQHDGQDYVAAVRAAMAAPPSVPPAGDALSGYRRQGSSSLRSGPAAIDTSTHHHSHHHSHGHGHSGHSHSHGRAPTAYHSTPQQCQHPQPDMAARFTHSFHPLSAGSGSARTSSDLTPHAETETPPSPHASRPAAPAPSPFVASHMTHQRCPTLHAYYSHVPYSSASDDPYGAHGARAHAGPTSLDRASHGSGHASHGHGHGHSTHASGVAAGAQGAAAAASGHLSLVARQNSHTSVGSSGSGFHSGIDAPAQTQVQGHSHVAATHGHAHGHVLSASHSMSHSRRHMHGPSGLAVRTDAHDDLGLAPGPGSAHSQAHSGPGSGSAPRSPRTGLPGFSGLTINTQPRQPQATSGVSSPRRLSAISVYPNGNGSSQLSAGPTSYTTYGYRRACSSLAALEPGAQTNSVSIEDSSSDDETEEATRRITAGYKTHTGMVRSSGWGLLGADSAPTTPTGEAARHRETWAAGANSGNLASALGGDEGKLGGEGEDGAGALNRKRGSYHLTNSHAAVELFLRLNHARQTMDFVKRQTQLFGAMDKAQMGVWEALHTLNELREYEAVLMAEGNEAQDLSELPLLDHAFQTAELCRLHHPDMDWLHLVGLIHGLGKLLAHRKFGSQPQWAICGETYPLGCRFSPHILGSQYFTANPDRRRRAYNTQTGIYNPGCGLLSVVMSWSAPEYLYLILLLNRAPMPEDALWVLRHAKFTTLARPHSCYLPLCSREDTRRLPLLRSFQTLAAYRRQELPPGFALEGEARTAYYTGLIHKYIGAGNLHW